MAEEATIQEENRRLRERLAQAKALIAEREANRTRQHEIKLRQLKQEEIERARQHELEMARLQLQIEQAKAANTMPAAINITLHEDEIAIFKKEVAAKGLKAFFKLEGSTNYESWRDKAFTQVLAIKARHTLTNNNQQGRTNCGYCNSHWHEEQDCRMKNYANQPQEWQTINALAIEYFKKKNESKTANPKPAAGLAPATPATPVTPSTPTSMANPNVGYTAIAFPTTKQSNDPPSEPNDDDDTVRIIPHDTAILDPVPRIVGAETVGAATKKKKKDLNSLSSRAEVPKMRCGWSKKQSIVDPPALLVWDLINSINQDKALSEDLNMWFCPFLASPNAKQWEAALEGD
jgi:hypothetical protein